MPLEQSTDRQGKGPDSKKKSLVGFPYQVQLLKCIYMGDYSVPDTVLDFKDSIGSEKDTFAALYVTF